MDQILALVAHAGSEWSSVRDEDALQILFMGRVLFVVEIPWMYMRSDIRGVNMHPNRPGCMNPSAMMAKLIAIVDKLRVDFDDIDHDESFEEACRDLNWRQ